jgi:hypothetical protein
VEVSRSGWSLTGYTWTVTYITPRIDFPVFRIEPTFIGGPGISSIDVTTLFNGSTSALFFNPMPSWMTEVPLSWATDGQTKSNVEIYRKTSSGDEVKAVCDSTGEKPSGLFGLLKGDENSCSFSYAESNTPIMSNYSIISFVDQYTSEIAITGSKFLIGSSSSVRVLIANQSCNITAINDETIICQVSNVPYGYHKVRVTIAGYGDALSTTDGDLLFKLGLYSVFPLVGSVRGGQSITIDGRGFRNDTTVSIGLQSCDILSMTSSKIVCLIPPVYVSRVGNATIINGVEINANASSWSSSVDITVDHKTFPTLFKYDTDSTPKVSSISPNDISSIATVTIEIIGTGFELNSTVTIANQTCVVQEIYPDLIICLLARSSGVPVSEVSVVVSVPGKGYAAESTLLYSLPFVNYGFEISSVFPLGGSIKGGSVLYISGFGFMDIDLNSQTVTLTSLTDPPTEYDDLLLALDLVGTSADPTLCHIHMPVPVTTSSSAHSHSTSPLTPASAHMHMDSTSPTNPNNTLHGRVFCEVLELEFDRIVCLLPRALDNTKENNYTVSVTVNGLTSACLEESCLFQESIKYTPQVSSVSLLGMDLTSGELTIALEGDEQFLRAGKINISIEYVDCYVTDVSLTTVTANCPCVHAGAYQVHAHIQDRGCVDIPLEVGFITAPLIITEITTPVTSGSYGGGPVAQISGHGFCSDCWNNSIRFNYPGGYIDVHEEDFLECTIQTLRFKMPAATTTSLSTAQELSVSDVTVTFREMSATSSFSYIYKPSLTPSVALNLVSGYEKTNITMTITSPMGYDVSQSAATIGGEPCLYLPSKVTSTTQFILTCGAPALPGDVTYPVEIYVHPFGTALLASGTPPTFLSLFQVSPMSPSSLSGSIGGGSSVLVTGRGLSSTSQISVCGINCPIVNVSYDSAICLAPKLKTVASVEYFDSISADFDDISELPGTLFSSSSSASLTQSVQDGNFLTSFVHNIPNCHLGITLPTGYVARPYRLRFYPRLQYSRNITNVIFEGSTDGGATYIVLDTMEHGHEGWNFFEASGSHLNMWFNKFRFRSPNTLKTSQCMIAEIKFLGVLAASSSACNVVVSSSPTATVKTTAGTLIYDPTSTPFIESVSPNNGTALGGTVVTLTGRNLLPKSGSYSEMSPMIHLNGMCCMVESVTMNEIICVTSERPLDHVTDVTSVSVSIEGRGDALSNQNARFIYLDKWSSLTSWKNQEPPVSGDMVWIPEGQTILLDISPPVLSVLLIEGELYFDQNKDLDLAAEYIIINGGKLQVGTEKDPYLRQGTITLHGDRYKSIEIGHIGSKALVVGAKGMAHSHDGTHHMTGTSGSLEIHGAKRLRTWTKLNTTAYAGQNFIVTSEPVDFALGEMIVITGSEIPGDSFYEEVVTVVQTLDNRQVYFEPSLVYTHRSEIVTVQGRVLDLRCEVGLLTRNIKVQGDETSDGQLFGSHMMTMGGGTFKIENVEITRCGQAFNLGRYCSHSHHAGPYEGNYVKANSIHHSYQRAVTTHDTSYWEVRDNVAYDIMGHAYFVEDGDEYYNTFSGNLGIRIKTSSALLASDTKPAVFWTSNPNNFWYDNVGVHSHSFGFWFELPSNPPDVPNICCLHEHLGEFINNTFRANGVFGLRIYPHWFPLVDPCNSSSAPAPQYLQNMLSYRNGASGLFSKKHGDLHHIGHTFLENGGHDVNIIHYQHVPYTIDPTFLNILFVGSLNPNFDENTNLWKFAIWAPQDEFFYVKNSTFLNYGTYGALTGCNGCDSGEFLAQDGYTYRFEDLTFIKTPRRVKWSPH